MNKGIAQTGGSQISSLAYKDGAVVGFENADYICDGIEDNVQIQEAIDNHSVVIIKGGTYDIQDTIDVPSDKIIEGIGFETILKLASGTNLNLIQNSDIVSGNENIEFRRFKIDGNRLNQTSAANGIQLTNVENFKIEHLKVEATYSDGISITTGVLGSIFNNYCKDLGTGSDGEGIVCRNSCYDISIFSNKAEGTVGDAILAKNGCYNLSIFGNTIFGSSEVASGIVLSDEGGAQVYNTSVFGNTIKNCAGRGIVFDNTKNCTALANNVDDIGYDGIWLRRSNQNSIVGNTIHNCSQDQDDVYSDIRLTYYGSDYSNRNTITGNICIEDGATKARYNILEDAGNTKNNISNNIVLGGKTGTVSSRGTGSTAKNNIGTNPDTVYAQGNISGATSFSRINGYVITATLIGDISVTLTGGQVNGDTLTLILSQDATGGRAVTWPSTFKKVGGVLNIASGASEKTVIKMEWDGTNWNEVSRNVNLS